LFLKRLVQNDVLTIKANVSEFLKNKIAPNPGVMSEEATPYKTVPKDIQQRHQYPRTAAAKATGVENYDDSQPFNFFTTYH
jgi:hypothetical protein